MFEERVRVNAARKAERRLLGDSSKLLHGERGPCLAGKGRRPFVRTAQGCTEWKLIGLFWPNCP